MSDLEALAGCFITALVLYKLLKIIFGGFGNQKYTPDK